LPGRERGTSRREYIRDAGDRPAVRVRGLPADSLRSLADLLQPDRLRRVLETHYFRVDKGARAPSSKIVATHLKLAARHCGLLPPQAVQAVETLANQVKAPNSGCGPARSIISSSSSATPWRPWCPSGTGRGSGVSRHARPRRIRASREPNAPPPEALLGGSLTLCDAAKGIGDQAALTCHDGLLLTMATCFTLRRRNEAPWLGSSI
jgi:hypothetical protein